ncbi:TM0106 family RecB-like putative nuclease [Cellulomonas rhizosphaerae]|uniref:TM0106 family RecB-like putative nuclease n=1 Tax=Cellulomonas rhizosphaerae TaxID=2293719 RepID=A0A413RH00_9CELL|nr:bifunctional RecB family nuclease/DEAD/DEAH box helicase [Cellulomonas rhizosphaerae]RHA37077.1 TM0106 family RecB-like putative nuclease [Cellulomonas rhizosphaerae]
MFLLDDGGLVLSPSDLTHAATCEFAVVRALDARLGRAPAVQLEADAMLARVSTLGQVHEQQVLAGYGPRVVQIARPTWEHATERATLVEVQKRTLAALRSGAPVVYQAGFFDGTFSGWADFVVRQPDDRYAVHDTKLARSAKTTALVQLAAYADQLVRVGVPTADEVHLVLGDRKVSSHRLADLLPVYRDRRARLEALLAERRADDSPLRWRDERYAACGTCDVCAPEVAAHRDVLLVADMRKTQRARLADAGIETIDALAASTEPVDGLSGATLGKLRLQARLQVGPGGVTREVADGAPLAFEVVDPAAIVALPAPSAGDIFFDFEGDPLWTDDSVPADSPADWGLEYLFGVVEAPVGDADPGFVPFWAHDRVQERAALVAFVNYVQSRLARHPDLHVYHYAPYEKTALHRLAGRHGVYEEVIDQWAKDGLLVDLYATVRHSLRVGAASYSLKKLEPLYMGDHLRESDVTNAAASIVEYAEACAERDAGHDEEWQRRLGEIADYNEYDCVSTLRLRDFLLEQVGGSGSADDGAAGPGAGGGDKGDGAGPEVDELEVRLREGAAALRAVVPTDEATDEAAARERDAHALELLGACLAYHQRDDKPFWWAHFARFRDPVDEWSDARSTLLVTGPVDVVADWHVTPKAKRPRRELRLRGTLEPGSEIRAGAKPFVLYDAPPSFTTIPHNGLRGATGSEVLSVETVEDDDAPGGSWDVVTVRETIDATAEQGDDLPMGLTPGRPPVTDNIAAAIRELATTVASGLPRLPQHAALDILRRVPPRTRSGLPLPRPDGPQGTTEAITDAVLDLDHSYLAVQGPPGTGKTYTGGHVIAQLAMQGWRIGVVAQSHAVVANMLQSVIAAGFPPERIAKRNKDKDADLPWRPVPNDRDYGAFYASVTGGGYVVGGTTWDFVNAKRMPDEPFDLLVVDEAGQFALANVVAVSGIARNLMLLGDPQQLPQVSQGSHPFPVDRSALGWLADGHDTLPDELGYFLDRTWRMHPDLTAAVSRLSYEDRLTCVPQTADRDLDGITPGVRVLLVDHEGDAVSSAAEATVVVEQVRAVVGRRWRDPADGTDRPLTSADVLVVAPYNAQVSTVRKALDAAGLQGTRVGTVDKFQGQEAPVALLTTAASSPDDVPRGMEFLINRNRVNVAISRAQWCAIVVRSRTLTDYLPSRPEQLAELGAFLGLGTPPD